MLMWSPLRVLFSIPLKELIREVQSDLIAYYRMFDAAVDNHKSIDIIGAACVKSADMRWTECFLLSEGVE
jgi:hypothetical protein